MALSRALSVIGLVSVSWAAAVGCGDDDTTTQPPGAAGEGGEAGHGGSVAGTSSGGSAGSGAGGSAGSGAGGTAGAGGEPVTGGAGGEPPVTPVGGAAGEGGAGGGTGGEPAGLFGKCGYECDTTEDCAPAEGVNGLECNLESHRCENPREVCEVDGDCLASATLWTATCESNEDCAEDGSESCILFRGVGYCALVAQSEGWCEPQEPQPMPHISGEGMVEVCVSNYGRCWDNKCALGCDDPQFFGFACEGAGNGDTCDETTGRCTCTKATEAEECDTQLCGEDGLCVECVSAADCVESPNGPECVNGKCGCGAAASCPALPAAIPVCE